LPLEQFRKGDFRIFAGHVYDGSAWVALKAGYTTGTMQVPLPECRSFGSPGHQV